MVFFFLIFWMANKLPDRLSPGGCRCDNGHNGPAQEESEVASDSSNQVLESNLSRYGYYILKNFFDSVNCFDLFKPVHHNCNGPQNLNMLWFWQKGRMMKSILSSNQNLQNLVAQTYNAVLCISACTQSAS